MKNVTVGHAKPRKRGLVLTVEDRRGPVLRKYELVVPWRLLNEEYESLSNQMANEALEHMKALNDGMWLPLEKWE